MFAVAWLMALFPDLDTASLPQRWYLRGMFLALLISLLLGRMDLFVSLALLALAPLLHKHRGWTHWKITPWLLAPLLGAAQEVQRASDSWFSRFAWGNVTVFLQDYWPFVLACVLGHYTHLILDSRRIRWLPFVRNPEGHH